MEGERMTKGQRIRQKREALNMSATELAKRLNVAKQTVYKYENDIITNIPSDVIERLSDELQCSPEYILGWKPSPAREVEQALELYRKYQQAIPQIQDAVDSLLKSGQSDS